MVKRKPFKEGDWFAVPIESGFVLGRIARVGTGGGILLGYFFEPLLPDVPTIDDTLNLTAKDAFYITKFCDPGLIHEGWPIIRNADAWRREDWPMPPMGRIFDFNKSIGILTQYDEADLAAALRQSRVTPERAMQFPDDGLADINGCKKDWKSISQKGLSPMIQQNSDVFINGIGDCPLIDSKHSATEGY